MTAVIRNFDEKGRDLGELWRRWVAANALSEATGLSLTLGLTGLIISRLESINGVSGILLAFGAAVVAGVIEATLVGFAQWWAMHPWLPSIRRNQWWLGTLGGALLAYILGYLPPTIIDLGAQVTGEAPIAEPPQIIVLLLAAGLGFVAGAVLSWAQWLVLRHHVERAGWWVPANMLAWMIAMPIIFWAVDLAYKMQTGWVIILFALAILLAVGALVGAIHGAVLVWLVGKQSKANS
jgi:hypothetical protein